MYIHLSALDLLNAVSRGQNIIVLLKYYLTPHVRVFLCRGYDYL